MSKFLNKIDNNKGADLQLTAIVMICVFVFAIFMAMDFWFASSAKILLIKETQAAEVYCLVKTIEGNYTELHQIADPYTYNLNTEQSEAIERFGTAGGTDEAPKYGEIYSRLGHAGYLKTWKIDRVAGISPPIGEMGIAMTMTYTTNTFIRSTDQIIGFLNGDNVKASANKPITLSVTAKVIPYDWET